MPRFRFLLEAPWPKSWRGQTPSLHYIVEPVTLRNAMRKQPLQTLVRHLHKLPATRASGRKKSRMPPPANKDSDRQLGRCDYAVFRKSGSEAESRSEPQW